MNINDQYRFIFDNLKDPSEFKILAHIYNKHGPEAGIKSLLGELPKKNAYDAFLNNEIAYNGEEEEKTRRITTQANTSIYNDISKVIKIYNNINPNNKPYILLAFEMFTVHKLDGVTEIVNNYQNKLFANQFVLTQNEMNDAIQSVEFLTPNKIIDFYSPQQEGIANRIPMNCFLGPELQTYQPNSYIFPEFSAWFQLSDPCRQESYPNGQFMQNGEIITTIKQSTITEPTFMFIFWNTIKNEMHLAASPSPYNILINKTDTKQAKYNPETKGYLICTRVSWTDKIQKEETSRIQTLDIELLDLYNSASPVTKWLKNIVL